MKNKILFFPGLGENPSQYKDFSKYMKIANIDWNNYKFSPKINGEDTLISFSLGATFALDYSQKHKIKRLILCSPTPFPSVKNCKAKEIIFLVGEKDFFLKEFIKKIDCKKVPRKIQIVKGTDHKISKEYKKVILDLIKK